MKPIKIHANNDHLRWSTPGCHQPQNTRVGVVSTLVGWNTSISSSTLSLISFLGENLLTFWADYVFPSLPRISKDPKIRSNPPWETKQWCFILIITIVDIHDDNHDDNNTNHHIMAIIMIMITHVPQGQCPPERSEHVPGKISENWKFRSTLGPNF